MSQPRNARVDDRWRFCGLDTLVLENDQLRVVVLPGAGAHIQQITHKPSGNDVLWENPRRDPSPPSASDPWVGWLGGVDEMIPTAWPSSHQGVKYAGHGDVLTLPWRYDVLDRGPDQASVRFFCDAFPSPIRIERTMTLAAGESEIRMRHRITNLGERAYDFLWGLHACFNGHFDHRIDIPAGDVYEEPFRPRFFDGGPIARYRWPLRPSGDATMDMSRPQPGPEMVLHYAMANDGWLAFTDLDRDIGMAVRFDRSVFPTLWLWIVRGRDGHRLAAVMPWTGYPARLEEAATRDGMCASLAPGETLVTSTRWNVYRGLRSVVGVDPDGAVRGGNA